jgi:Arc/MetJ-type ribon-helix-helix transcriptional regulator
MEEPIQVGLSKDGHEKLLRLKEDGHFADMADAYRFAIALAIAHGAMPEDKQYRNGPTIFNTGSLDPDRSLYTVIKALFQPLNEPVYRLAERLAEWGVNELYRLSEKGSIPVSELIEEASRLSETRSTELT